MSRGDRGNTPYIIRHGQSAVHRQDVVALKMGAVDRDVIRMALDLDHVILVILQDQADLVDQRDRLALQIRASGVEQDRSVQRELDVLGIKAYLDLVLDPVLLAQLLDLIRHLFGLGELSLLQRLHGLLEFGDRILFSLFALDIRLVLGGIRLGVIVNIHLF